MRISDWSSDVCSSDLLDAHRIREGNMSISGNSFDSFNRHLLIGCRPRKPMQASQPSNVSTAETARPPVARNWLWKPWYAKLWWAAIPVYWTGAVALGETIVKIGRAHV